MIILHKSLPEDIKKGDALYTPPLNFSYFTLSLILHGRYCLTQSQAGKGHKTLIAHIYNFDPTLAPEGKTVIKVMFNTDYDYWERLYKDPERYKAEKEQIADTVVTLLDRRFPGLAAQVEMRDVATPMTWVRYTGNWRGAYEGWMMTPRTLMMHWSKTLPGLDNFYMAGQWVVLGSMPSVVVSGRHTIQIICKKKKKKFVTSTP
jgi:phytoene dehydrogenase-like protein